MCAARVGDQPSQPRVHLFYTDEVPLAAARQQRAQRRGLQRVGTGTSVPARFRASGEGEAGVATALAVSRAVQIAHPGPA